MLRGRDYPSLTAQCSAYCATLDLREGGPGIARGMAAPLRVPEPATLAMMILGFGAVGQAMRKRPARSLCAA